MSGSFAAKYRGRCYECPEPIEVGDQIVWAGDDTRMVAHVDCADRDSIVAGRREPQVCPTCFLAHAGECF